MPLNLTQAPSLKREDANKTVCETSKLDVIMELNKYRVVITEETTPVLNRVS